MRRLSRILGEILLLPVRFYRRFLSPITPATCRYSPTCSQYAIDAVRGRGVLYGILLTAWRILRCHPFSKGGYDPVPLPNRNGGDLPPH